MVAGRPRVRSETTRSTRDWPKACDWGVASPMWYRWLSCVQLPVMVVILNELTLRHNQLTLCCAPRNPALGAHLRVVTFNPSDCLPQELQSPSRGVIKQAWVASQPNGGGLEPPLPVDSLLCLCWPKNS